MTKNLTVPENLKKKYNLCWEAESLQYLGIILTKGLTKLAQLNYEPLFSKMKSDILRWNLIPFLNLNSINAVKRNVLPRLLYIFQTLPVEVNDNYFKEWDKWISWFVWQGKNPRIRFSVLQLGKGRGGMALPCLREYFFTSHLVPLLYWFNPDYEAKWKELEYRLSADFPLQAAIADRGLAAQVE